MKYLLNCFYSLSIVFLYANSLHKASYSRKQPLYIEGLFTVAQSLFAHVGVGQTYLHRQAVLAKSISVNQTRAHTPAVGTSGLKTTPQNQPHDTLAVLVRDKQAQEVSTKQLNCFQ